MGETAESRWRVALAAEPKVQLDSFEIVRRLGHRGKKDTETKQGPDYFGCESIVVSAYLKGRYELGPVALKIKLSFQAQNQSFSGLFQEEEKAQRRCKHSKASPAWKNFATKRARCIPELAVLSGTNPCNAGESKGPTLFHTDSHSNVMPVYGYFIDRIDHVPEGLLNDAWKEFRPLLSQSTVVVICPCAQFGNLNQVFTTCNEPTLSL